MYEFRQASQRGTHAQLVLWATGRGLLPLLHFPSARKHVDVCECDRFTYLQFIMKRALVLDVHSRSTPTPVETAKTRYETQ